MSPRKARCTVSEGVEPYDMGDGTGLFFTTPSVDLTVAWDYGDHKTALEHLHTAYTTAKERIEATS